MKFRLQITASPGNDISRVEVDFDAPIWKDAAVWANKFIDQIGLAGQCETLITKAPKEEAR